MRLGVNRSTVASLVGDLAERGLVAEHAPRARTTPGRPSPLVGPRRDGPVVVAAEISTDSLAVAVVTIGGRILDVRRVAMSHEPGNAFEIADRLVEIARPLVERRGPDTRIFGVGVSVPGVVRQEDGFVHVAPNLQWRDVPLGQIVRDRLFFEAPVRVGNDANLATLAEHLRGAGAGHDDFICLWGEAGLGAGIVVGGRQFTGSEGYAGEVGHLPVNPAGRQCRCGSRGCWETEVGEVALLRDAGMDPADEASTLDALFARADAGDPAALDAMATVGKWLGVGLAGLVSVFNPTMVALGGLYARLYPYVRPALQSELAARVMPASRRALEIVPALLGPDSALVGAAELAFARIIADPTLVPVPAHAVPYRRHQPSPPDGLSEGGERAARPTM